MLSFPASAEERELAGTLGDLVVCAAMGLGLGTVQVLRHDGAGHLTVDDRPFVLSRDDAMLDVGEF